MANHKWVPINENTRGRGAELGDSKKGGKRLSASGNEPSDNSQVDSDLYSGGTGEEGPGVVEE